jgi:exopolysaccharide biosynthesis polyprenyl glycosylphosphotransferase
MWQSDEDGGSSRATRLRLGVRRAGRGQRDLSGLELSEDLLLGLRRGGIKLSATEGHAAALIAPANGVLRAPRAATAERVQRRDNASLRQRFDRRRTVFIVLLAACLGTLFLAANSPATVVGATVACIAVSWGFTRLCGASIPACALRPGTAAVVGGVLAVGLVESALLAVGRLTAAPNAGVIGAAALVVLVSSETALARRVLLVGHGGAGAELVEELRRSETPFEIVATIGDEETRTWDSIPSYVSVTALPEAVATHQPDLIVVNVATGRPEVFEELLELAGSGFRIVGVPEFYEHAFGRVPVNHLTAAWFMSILHLYQRRYTVAAKRGFDIAVALLAILVTAPLLLPIAILVGRPVFFRQVRVGQWGRPFTMYKFRTMCERSEEPGVALFAAENDDRITDVGRVLRKTHLDELPQLWNVLIGDMSIVGPRPERPEFYDELSKEVPWWVRRNIVKPGITGWAQIHHGYADNAQTISEKLAYDLWYLRHQRLLVDILICVRTLPKLVLTSGAR